MGFNCIICNEREIWAAESNIPRICNNCYIEHSCIIQTQCYQVFRVYRYIMTIICD